MLTYEQDTKQLYYYLPPPMTFPIIDTESTVFTLPRHTVVAALNDKEAASICKQRMRAKYGGPEIRMHL